MRRWSGSGSVSADGFFAISAQDRRVVPAGACAGAGSSLTEQAIGVGVFWASVGVGSWVLSVAGVGRGGRTGRGIGGVAAIGAELVVAGGLGRGIRFSMVFCRPRTSSFSSSI